MPSLPRKTVLVKKLSCGINSANDIGAASFKICLLVVVTPRFSCGSLKIKVFLFCYFLVVRVIQGLQIYSIKGYPFHFHHFFVILFACVPGEL
jgi:hypothetical protein